LREDRPLTNNQPFYKSVDQNRHDRAQDCRVA
jgi:hypothetical protein